MFLPSTVNAAALSPMHRALELARQALWLTSPNPRVGCVIGTEDGALLSEDYYFCDLFRKHGGKIYAHPFVKLTHTGTYIFRGDALKACTLHL